MLLYIFQYFGELNKQWDYITNLDLEVFTQTHTLLINPPQLASKSTTMCLLSVNSSSINPHLLSLSHLFCRQWPHPAVAVSTRAADRQVLPVLHQLDRRRLGVQTF